MLLTTEMPNGTEIFRESEIFSDERIPWISSDGESAAEKSRFAFDPSSFYLIDDSDDDFDEDFEEDFEELPDDEDEFLFEPDEDEDTDDDMEEVDSEEFEDAFEDFDDLDSDENSFDSDDA